MKRIVIGLTLATASVFLVGCGAEEGSHGDSSEVYPENYHQVDPPGNGGYPTNFFTTEIDGITCRVAVVYEAVAMDCEDDNLGVTP